MLPSYVEEIARRRWKLVERELEKVQVGEVPEEVVGKREVNGVDGMRREVEEFLLVDE